MNSNHSNRLCVKLVHCGNRNIADPDDHVDKYVFYMPMGIFSLASILDENGFDVEILHLDLEVGSNIDDLLSIERLDAVGLDMQWVNQAPAVVNTLELVKKKKPGVFIFLGGYTAGFYAREILETYPQVDAIIRGDGEIPIVELCTRLLENKQNCKGKNGCPPGISLENVQNLVWRRKNGEIVENVLSYVSSAEEMNQFTFTEVSLLRNWTIYRDISKFWTRFPTINKHPIFFIEVGRGCAYNCIICGGNAHAQLCLSNRKKQAIRSVDSVINSIKEAISYNYSLFFTCFEFEGCEEWYRQLFRLIREERLQVNFAYESWGLLSKSIIEDLSRSFREVIVTISPDSADLTLRKKNKDPRLFYTNEDLEERLDYISTRGNMKVQLYFGYFLPFETPDTIFKTMDYITNLLVKYGHFTEIIFMNNNTDPCSSLFFDPGKYNIDLTVCRLEEYIEKIKENYKIEKGIPSPQTLLCKPADMTDAEAVDIANKAVLFSGLLYFRRSIAALVKEVKRTDIIAAYLMGMDLSTASANHFEIAAIKKVLIDICKKHGSPRSNGDMLRIIESEYRENSREPGIKSPTFYTTGNGHGALTEAEKSKISQGIRKAREDIQADFDI